MIRGSSSNTNVVLDVGEEYPYPSHVCAPNFVTVKLSGRDKFGVWKTQMLCLLESHGMLDFVNGTLRSPPQSSVFGKEKDGDYMLWRRSDALVKGWILGSLSEQALSYVASLLKRNADFTAKDLWDNLLTIYGPPVLLQHPDFDGQDETIRREDESFIKESFISEDAKSNNEETEEKKKKEAEERAKAHQKLYEATLRQSFEEVSYILRRKDVGVTDKITINGNTALHVAVGTTKNLEFIQNMLKKAKGNSLLGLRNSDGSTLLHVAAIVGNKDAARILVGRDRSLLFAKDNDGNMPLARALSNMHTDTYLFLLDPTQTHDIEMGTLFAGSSGDELLVNAISSNDFGSALVLGKHYHKLHSDAVLMAIAQNFPRKLNIWERMVHKFIRVPEDLEEGISYKELDAFCHTLKTYCMYIFSLGAIFLLFVGVLPFSFVDQRARMRADATFLLKSTCNLIKHSEASNSHHNYYTNPVLEATRQNAYEVVVMIVSSFPNAIWSMNEDGHNIIQYAVINRSETVYNLLYQMSEHKNVYKTIKDPLGNNLLHLAARLATPEKLNHISGAALQIQHELQWFKEVEGFVCPLNIIQKNSFGETPQMVFTREHKDLVIEGEKWMKATAESYTITAALITTIVFAAAITVPGGNNQDTGIPIFTNNLAFTIFAVSDAISLFTSVTSLLMFLSILTTRFAQQDFLYKLPTKLIIGLATLFISTTAMIIAFGATLFLVFGQKKSWILTPIAALTCLPITSFVTLQFPLIADLISSTYGRSIFGKKSDDPFY